MTKQDGRLLSHWNIKGMARRVADATLGWWELHIANKSGRCIKTYRLPSSFSVLYVSYSAKGIFCCLIILIRLCDRRATCRKQHQTSQPKCQRAQEYLSTRYYTHGGHSKYILHEAIALIRQMTGGYDCRC